MAVPLSSSSASEARTPAGRGEVSLHPQLRQQSLRRREQFVEHLPRTRSGRIAISSRSSAWRARFRSPFTAGLDHQLLPGDALLQQAHQRERRLARVEAARALAIRDGLHLQDRVVRQVRHHALVWEVEDAHLPRAGGDGLDETGDAFAADEAGLALGQAAAVQGGRELLQSLRPRAVACSAFESRGAFQVQVLVAGADLLRRSRRGGSVGSCGLRQEGVELQIVAVLLVDDAVAVDLGELRRP